MQYLLNKNKMIEIKCKSILYSIIVDFDFRRNKITSSLNSSIELVKILNGYIANINNLLHITCYHQYSQKNIYCMII